MALVHWKKKWDLLKILDEKVNNKELQNYKKVCGSLGKRGLVLPTVAYFSL